WNGSWLIWSPLSTPTMRAAPATRKRTSGSAVGTGTPAESSTVTVTNDRSLPSAWIVPRSGASVVGVLDDRRGGFDEPPQHRLVADDTGVVFDVGGRGD